MTNPRRGNVVQSVLFHTVLAGFLAVLGMSSGCGDTPGPLAPTPPTTPPVVAPVSPPVVLAVSPTRGATGGGTVVTITGSGFQTGATATLGDARLPAIVEGGTTIRVTTAAHDAGPVEIVVTNPDGQAVTFTGGYSYVPPQSFDFNGTWDGNALAHPEAQFRSTPRHSDMELRFTIEGDRLTNITCGGMTLALASPPPVSDGAFSHTGEDGAAITGRIVSEVSAVGTIDTGACPATRWTASRR